MMGKKSTQLFGAKLFWCQTILVPNCPFLTPDATLLVSRETWFLVNSYNDIVDDDYNDEKYYE